MEEERSHDGRANGRSNKDRFPVEKAGAIVVEELKVIEGTGKVEFDYKKKGEGDTDNHVYQVGEEYRVAWTVAARESFRYRIRLKIKS